MKGAALLLLLLAPQQKKEEPKPVPFTVDSGTVITLNNPNGCEWGFNHEGQYCKATVQFVAPEPVTCKWTSALGEKPQILTCTYPYVEKKETLK